ncbi:MAG TPA: CBS domain-containing protein [Gaiellaceae bacterium]|nr:CBS domain-containing protein [Gaiellaceae bacterium]
MKVKDVMTTTVATAGPDTTLKQAAEVMVDRGVSGLPVVDEEGGVLGVVSEADIIVKAASRPERAGALGRLFAPEAADERHLAATTAGEAMTAPAVTIDAEQSVAEAARVMVEREVNRLPVLAGGKLAGIVSRGDLVRSFVRPDAAIREELRGDVIWRKLLRSPDDVEIAVAGGRVTIAGRTETRTAAELVEAFAWRVPGVVSVDCSGLAWEIDDWAPRSAGLPQASAAGMPPPAQRTKPARPTRR